MVSARARDQLVLHLIEVLQEVCGGRAVSLLLLRGDQKWARRSCKEGLRMA